MQQVLRCGTIRRHHNDDFISSDLTGLKCLIDLHIGTVNYNEFQFEKYGDKGLLIISIHILL